MFTHEFYTDKERTFILVFRTYPKRNILYISIIGIRPKNLRKGVGGSILQDLTKLNYKYLEGHISVENKNSLKMVEKEGYMLVKEIDYYKDKSKNTRAYLVRKTTK